MNLKKFFAAAACCLFVVLFSSCGSLGYGVMLWGDQEHNIPDGSIVKVYIQSNISHTYVISALDSKEKIEIPLWKITEPQSKSKAKKQAKKYEEYQGTFASVVLDGLPIRQDAINTSKQVYRLRQDEVIRVLYKGQGAAVSNGSNIAGEWLRVLTSTGTSGWCFSAKLDLYKGSISGERFFKEAVVEGDDADPVLEEAVAKNWYPEYYNSFIRNKKIDLKRISDSYGFKFGIEEKSASIKTDELKLNFSYSQLNKLSEGKYEFKDSDQKLQVKFEGADAITVTYVEKGKPKTVKFISMEEEALAEIIDAEKERRLEEVRAIAANGPVFFSSNYGTISFTGEGKITWRNYGLLVPNIISREATGEAEVKVEYFLSNQLKATYDGVLTFYFAGQSKPVNFFYKVTDTGLRLEESTGASVKDNTLTTRGTSPLIMFFSK